MVIVVEHDGVGAIDVRDLKTSQTQSSDNSKAYKIGIGTAKRRKTYRLLATLDTERDTLLVFVANSPGCQADLVTTFAFLRLGGPGRHGYIDLQDKHNHTCKPTMLKPQTKSRKSDVVARTKRESQ